MKDVKRKFNQKLYDECDMNAKIASIQLMKNKGYHMVGDIDEEHYKKYDLEFHNPEINDTIFVENEYRGNYTKIKNFYKTVHIPIRKKNSKCTYYFVWGNDYKEVGIIKMEDIKKFRDKPVDVTCLTAGLIYDGDIYTEEFIDVPKEYVKFFKKNDRGKWKVTKPEKYQEINDEQMEILRNLKKK